MNRKIRVSLSLCAVFLLLLVPAAGFAQEITGSVRGIVQTPSGEPAVGETVTITDTRTGSSRSVTTNDRGSFNVRGLTVGGPFTIRVDSDQYRSTVVTDVYTKLSGVTTFTIMLEEQGVLEEVIVVSSSTVAGADLAIGPSTSFTLSEIEALPTISRQIRDIVRLDPRVGIGRAAGGNGFGISCSGASGRSNSFSIDGVSSADGFGLNASGNSARNTFPVPFDTVRAASVEFAPMDVQYGRFTGCNINVVTKSGTNEFTGSAFYLFNDDSLTGDTLEGDTVITEAFEETDWGFELGGPIIKDKLFFYVAYEETDEGSVQNNGPIGGGFANEGGITVAEVTTIANILRNQYGRDPGFIVRTLPQFSERTFGRIDWNVNDNHRVELTYVKLEELNLEEDDYRFVGFTTSDNFEEEGTDQEAISFRLFSDWNERFSTEVRLSTLDVQDIQGPLGGGEAQDDNKVRIQVQEPGRGDILLSGPGQFRSANDLAYTLDQAKLAGFYELGDHRLTFGYELDSLDVFNLFVVNATGLIEFASIADLASGLAFNIDGNGSFTGDINDAAASFSRNINSYYLQDEWTASDRLTVTGGIRFDSYDSNDNPIENPIWEARYGFKNTQAFDGLDISLPRIGLTYDIPDSRWGEMQIRAGFGVFTGGDPTVHFSNAFSNFGGAVGRGRSFSAPCTAADLQVINGGVFTGIPNCIIQQQISQATQNKGRADAVDPNFELPSQQRWNLGMSLTTDSEIDFLDEWDVQLDFIYSDHRNSIEFLDLTLTQRVDSNGLPIFLPDGRPQFFAIDPLLPGCNARFLGGNNGFTAVTSACNAGRDDQDILLTNGPSGSTTSISMQLAKSFYLGENTSLDFRFGYAYTDAKIGNPVNSSTATSGFEEVATAVINRNVLGPAVYANKHNFVIGTTFKHYFFEDNPTTIGLFFRTRSGRPFSYTYDNNTPTTLFGDSDNEERNLFYVPTGPNDPLVDLSSLQSAGTLQAFFDFLQRTGLNKFAGKISGKNAFEQEWTSDLDVRIAQEIPLGNSRHSLKLFLDIENILNMFSDSNNLQRFNNTGDVQEGVPVLDARLSSDGTQYIYSNFNPGGSNSAPSYNPVLRDVNDSVWRVQLGLRYTFR